MTTTYAEARPSYISDAFFVQYNLILLGGTALFSLASASPLPLGCGLVLEAIYLLVAPNLVAFRRYSDSRYVSVEAAQIVPAAGATLDAGQAARVAGFERRLGEVQRLRAPQPLPVALLLDQLDGAAERFARLCELDQRLARELTAMSQADLEAELTRLHAACEAEQDAMQRVSLRLAQNTVKRKLTQRHELAGKQRTVQLGIERIEQAMHQLGSRSPSALPGPELEQHLGSISAELASLEALEGDAPSLPT